MSRLSVRNLEVTYVTKHDEIRAVDRVSFYIEGDEIFGIVGESGCGKSTLASTLLNLLDENGEITAGEIHYEDRNLTAMSERQLAREIRGQELAMVFQDPSSSLDPVYTIGRQLIETIRQHLDVTKAEARERAIDSLSAVGIPDPEARLGDYPHQFSGGMKQRVVIAIALSCDPGLLIADEPTTGLDVSIQAQILELLHSLNHERDMAIVLITHDLGVIAEVCDRVGVMYAGNLVEIGPVEDLFDTPRHPYTRALLDSIPESHESRSELTVIEGVPPDLRNPPDGCRYHPRCAAFCCESCDVGDVPPAYRDGEATVRCYLYDADENPEYDGTTEIVDEAPAIGEDRAAASAGTEHDP